MTFSYEDGRPALAGVSFRVPEGGLVAVVGPTGSGKSTLGLLLCRLFEPPRGTVFVGGVDVRDSAPAPAAPVGGLRAAGGLSVFPLAPRQCAARPTAAARPSICARGRGAPGSAEEVRGLSPTGWDTVVGERGLTLSGGQRQRAALARALAGDPPYLVLDDVLASVDAAKEWEILRSLRARRERAHDAAHDPPAARRPGGGLDRGARRGAGWSRRAAMPIFWRRAGSTRGSGASSSSRTSSPMHDDEVLGRAYDARLMGRIWARHAAAPPARARCRWRSSRPWPALELLQPYLVKLAIDDYILARDWVGLGRIAALFLGGAPGALYGLRVAQAYVTQLTGQRVMHDLRSALFAHLAVAGRALLRPEPGGPADDARAQRRGGDQRAVHERRGLRSSATC